MGTFSFLIELYEIGLYSHPWIASISNGDCCHLQIAIADWRTTVLLVLHPRRFRFLMESKFCRLDETSCQILASKL